MTGQIRGSLAALLRYICALAISKYAVRCMAITAKKLADVKLGGLLELMNKKKKLFGDRFQDFGHFSKNTLIRFSVKAGFLKTLTTITK